MVMAATINVKVDIDSTRKSGSDVSGTFTTQSGFTSWNLTTYPAAGSALLVEQGTTFQIFGTSADASRTRAHENGGGGGPFDALLEDFVFNESATAQGRAVGLRISGLDVGTYRMQSWHFDSTGSVTSTDNFTQVDVRGPGVGGVTTVLLDKQPYSQQALSYKFDVTAVGNVELIYREDDAATTEDPIDQNRARLNGFTILTVPEPSYLLLLCVGAFVAGTSRRFIK
jgi:hypothetical protein